MDLKPACIVLLLIACVTPAAAASVIQLTNDSALNSLPFWSPDGTEIAFTSFDDGHAGIRIINSDGQNLRQLTDKHSWEFAMSDPWSPDGKKLLFLSDDAGEPDLWTMNPDGTDRMCLTGGGRIIPGLPVSGYGADWSADGKQIVYTYCQFNNSAIWKNFVATAAEESPAVDISAIRKEADIRIMNADGSSGKQLTTGGNTRSPHWQPQGDKIAYILETSGKRELWIMNDDGTGKIQVTRSRGNVSEYAWSPDGREIACVVATPTEKLPEFSIWITNTNGSYSKQLTSGNQDRNPVWSPDGSRIAFRSESGKRTAIRLINSDGSDLTTLTPGDTGFYMTPRWSPDGKQIALSDGNNLYTIVPEEQTEAPPSPGFEAFAVVAAASMVAAGRALKRR